MEIKNFAKNPTTSKGLKLYTAKEEGFNYESSIASAEKKLGVKVSKIVDSLIKNIMVYYPHKWNCARINPHTYGAVSISFPIIKDCKITNRDYPVFTFKCNGKIESMSCESQKYPLDCVAIKYNYDNYILPEIERKQKEFLDLLEIAGLNTEGKVKVSMEYITNYGETKKIYEWEEDSYKELFDDYVTANDRLKYINGTNWRFADENVNRAFRMFIDNYDGNYYLDNAVRRGVTID